MLDLKIAEPRVLLERSMVEIRVKDKVLEQQQREIQSLKKKLALRSERRRDLNEEAGSSDGAL